MKYPIGIQSFDQIIEGGFVYVDKTDLVYSLVDEGKVYFLSRPRRFGKSLLVSTLENYFRGRRELFKGLKIDALEKEWAEYPVFHIDFSGSVFTEPGSLEKKLEECVSAWEREYGKSEFFSSVGERFIEVLRRARKRTGRRCVVLVDEYDKPVQDLLDSKTRVKLGVNDWLLEDWHRTLLSGFYSVFKAADADLHFVLLTGETKYSQETMFRSFNQHIDLTMHPRYEALCGITQEELERYFAGPIAELAKRRGVDEAGMRELLRRRYGGYRFGSRLTEVYNPFSLLNAFDKQDIADYWFRDGNPARLVRLLSESQVCLDEMTNREFRPAEFADCRVDVERPLAMIYQRGYLTIKGYTREYDVFLLDFPNDEVKEGFLTVVAADYFKTRDSVSYLARRLNNALRDGDTEEFREVLTAFLAGIPYDVRRREDERERERYFQYTFYLISRTLGVYTVRAEERQSRGRVDCVVETPGRVYVFEFKLDGSADEALRQIEERGYVAPYGADGRKVCRVGVSFSSETGTIEDWKVEG